MRTKLRYSLLTILLLAAATPARGQSPLSLSTAGASLALSQGVEALHSNPAHLAMHRLRWVEFRLLGVGAGLHSNGLGLDDYRRYNGATLDDDDKANILEQIPADGLALWSEGVATVLAVRSGAWGLSASGQGSARGNLDREAVDLLLHGNVDQPDWSFTNSNGQGMASWQIALSHGRQIFTLNGGPVYAGLSAAYVRGLYLAEADQVTADLATQTTGLSGQPEAEWITADGGAGFGVDAGLAWRARPNLLISLAASHLYHSIKWDNNVERTEYLVVFDDITVDNYSDSLWETTETTESLSSFRQGLPVHLRLGAGLTSGATRYALEAAVWTADRFSASTKPSLSAGMEYMLGRSFPLRFGLSAGGRSEFAVGCGAGLHLGGFALGLGLRFDRAIWIGSGSGLSVATAIDIAI